MVTGVLKKGATASGPARDLWIEIGRAENRIAGSATSGPARDLWIEIEGCGETAALLRSRVPQGTCGLKYFGVPFCASRFRRVPQGTCGLKWHDTAPKRLRVLVGSRKGPVD